MERVESVQEGFPDLVKEWQRREVERKSRKHPRDVEGKAAKGQEADGGGAERPANAATREQARAALGFVA
jgi:hypothetical protein